jgi:hypothetical protein
MPCSATKGSVGVNRRALAVGVVLVVVPMLGVAVSSAAGSANADTGAYLVNVTVRPGYNFANASEALEYGLKVCHRVAQGRSYAEVITDIKTDFSNPDDYQASYLITQAVNELCPVLIWQVRNSAAGYRAPTT